MLPLAACPQIVSERVRILVRAGTKGVFKGVPAGCGGAAANVSAGGKPPFMIPNHTRTPPIGRSGVSAGPRPGRRTRATRLLIRIAVAAGVLLVLAGAGTSAFIIRRAFPQIAGRLTVPGLLAGVEVIRRG